MLSEHTGFIGLIVPGGWEAFFRTIGEPYEGATFPTNDNRPFHATLLPRLQKAAEEHDMQPVPRHQSWAPNAWSDSGNETVEFLPNALKPYFLRATTGPKCRLGGWVIRRMCGMNESSSRFTVYEMSGLGDIQELPFMKFRAAHHCFFVTEGTLGIALASSEGLSATEAESRALTAGETG